MSSKQIKREGMKKKALEDGFNLTNMNRAKVSEYNALYDPNMRHYFENRNVQRLLYSSGQIDKHGRVINLDKNKSKIYILEREFREAEKIEERRMQEEMEMRYRVQRKRFEELERIRKEEILQKLREDKEISKEILSTMRMTAPRSSRSLMPINSATSAGSVDSGFKVGTRNSTGQS